MKKLMFIFVCVSSLGLSACFQTRADLSHEESASDVKRSLNESLQAHSEQLAELQSEYSQLLSRLDLAEHQNKENLAKQANPSEVAREREEAENRIRALEENQKTLFEEIKNLHESKLKDLERGEPEHKSKGVSIEEAQKLLKARNYEAASSVLKQFLKTKPKAKKRLQAQYLLGEALFQSEDYSEAILSFSEVNEKSPDEEPARKSALRIAESFQKLGKKREAKTFAQLVVEKYPNSEEARKAKRLLR